MQEVTYYRIEIPFDSTKEAKEDVRKYRIIGRNDTFCVINDLHFTTIRLKKCKYSSSDTHLNEVSAYKSKWGFRDDGWKATLYCQTSEKIARRKIFTALKKIISKEMFMDGEALRTLELMFKKIKR